MRRHETDWLALSFGGLFLVVAAVHVGDGADGAGSTDGLKWFIPGVLLVLGLLGIIGAVRGSRTPARATGGPAAEPSATSWAPLRADEPTVRLDHEPDHEPTVRLDREPDAERDPEPAAGPDADPAGAARAEEGEDPKD